VAVPFDLRNRLLKWNRPFAAALGRVVGAEGIKLFEVLDDPLELVYVEQNPDRIAGLVGDVLFV
jgi:hypothetical protein